MLSAKEKSKVGEELGGALGAMILNSWSKERVYYQQQEQQQ